MLWSSKERPQRRVKKSVPLFRPRTKSRIQQQPPISIKDLPGMFCNWVSGAPPASDQPHSRRPLQTGRTELEQELQQRKVNVMGDATGVTASSCSCARMHLRAGNKAQAETQHEQGLETSCSIRVKTFHSTDMANKYI